MTVRGIVMLVLLLMGASQTWADSPSRRGGIAYPQTSQTTPAAEYKVHNWYLGVVGGWDWDEFGDSWLVGGYGEYRWRPNESLGLGIEADLVGLERDWLVSVRGKGGLYLGSILYGYGTAGIAWIDRDDAHFVYGGGLEMNLVSNWTVRGEVLRYEADDPGTVARVGLGLRF